MTFARWCDAKFSVWCDMCIDGLLNTDPATRQKYGQACQLLDDRRSEASQGGSLLANWRWSRPGLEKSIAYWREQLQLPLSLDES
ncbi:ORF11CD3 domain protein [compost metagenome]